MCEINLDAPHRAYQKWCKPLKQIIRDAIKIYMMYDYPENTIYSNFCDNSVV